jgi:hypothetical protein
MTHTCAGSTANVTSVLRYAMPFRVMLQQKSFVSEERKKGNGKGSQRRSGSFTSSTALTPGTPFMHDVCVSISHFVCAKLGQDKWRHVSGVGRTAHGSVAGSEGTVCAASMVQWLGQRGQCMLAAGVHGSCHPQLPWLDSSLLTVGRCRTRLCCALHLAMVRTAVSTTLGIAGAHLHVYTVPTPESCSPCAPGCIPHVPHVPHVPPLVQLEFEVSGPTVAGEGEVKVLGRLARPRDANAVTSDDTHSKTQQPGALALIWQCFGSRSR